MMTSCMHGQVPNHSLVPANASKKGKMDADDWKPGSIVSTFCSILFETACQLQDPTLCAECQAQQQGGEGDV